MAVAVGRSFTIEEIPGGPVADNITHRVIGHTLGPDHPYVMTLGTLETCEAEVRRLEDKLRRYYFKALQGAARRPELH